MSIVRHLLLLTLAVTAAYALKGLDAEDNCGSRTDPDLENLPFDQVERQGNLDRFCQETAGSVRREHFWCGGYVDDEGEIVEDSALEEFPSSANDFWSIFLQFPVLSWMDVARKRQVMQRISEVAVAGGCAVEDYRDFCVANVETFDVAEYRESVLIHLYNLGPNGIDFNTCFQSGMDSLEGNDNNDGPVTRFRSRPAFRLTLNVSLTDMFSQNIGPASSIGREDRDPTLRPIILGSWPGNVSRDDAQDDRSDFGSNPDPINYGLEAGDIVFAVFGSILLVILGIIVVLGFFVHPFFFS